MWDLIVSVPDHCLSFYLVPSQLGIKGCLSDFKNCRGGYFLFWVSIFNKEFQRYTELRA